MQVSLLRSAARWLWPSVVAACAGTVVAGLVEGAGEGGVLGAIASAGFSSLLALPCLFVASVAVRALWVAWKPRELALVEDNGGAPRLAGWALTIVLGAFALAWAMFAGTWQLAGLTAFKPLPMSFAEPILAVAAALAIAILSRPVARAFTALARLADRRWTRTGRAPLFSPTRIAIAAAVLAMAIVYALWRLMVLPRIGTLDLTPLRGPVAGLAALALAHVAWNRLAGARRLAGPAIAAIAAGAIATAMYAWRAEPSLTLSIWGDRPIAGLAIDRIFDLDRIRSDIPFAQFAPTPRAGAPHPDIILVTIDTVRADHTPPYGGHAEMPVLHELGQRGSVFEWAFSPSNVTRRSIPSLIIGLAPDRVRGRVVGWALRVDPRYVLLPERLRAGGYETAGFMCCEGIWGKSARTGLARGLDHLDIDPRENGSSLAKTAHAWLDQRAASGDHKPLFLWMHLLEPHNWQAAYGMPRDDEERRRFYDRTLASSDRMLGELLAAFANRPPEQAPIIIVTADHGEALGDHGQPYHSTDLYDSQIHVPLVIAGPGIQPGRIPETVSLTDLAPTILDLAGFGPPDDRGIEGASFAGLATGRRPADPDGGVAYSAMIKDRSNPGGIKSIVHGRWKLIDNGSSAELYDVHADPDERSNLVAVKPALLQPLRMLLHERELRADVSPF